jgi:hypothetical protein
VKELTRELGRIAAAIEAGSGRREAGGAAMEAVRALRRRARRGEFAGLLAEPMRAAMTEAARGRTFEDELAALRATLYRVLGDEELDVLRQTQAVTQVVGMTVRAARERAAVKKTGEQEELRGMAALLELLGAGKSPLD